MLPMRRFPAAGLCLGVVTLGLVQELTFSLYRTSAWAVGQVASNGGLRGSHMARRAEAFDPFGLKGALKDTVEGLMDGLSGDEEPSQEEEQMVVEIFEKFDLDRDGVLNLKEFNELQMTTEGSEALYNADQLKSLLLAVNPDMEKPELGMPFADYRRLYLEGRMRRAYSTDLRKDYQKIFGADHKPVVTAEPVVDTVAVDPPAAAPAPAAPAPPATLAPPVPAGTGTPSGAPSDRTEPMAEVLPNPSVDSEKSGKDVELGENKVERSLSPKKAEDKARSIVDEQATDRGKLMLMVPVLLLVVGLVLTLLLLFLGAMPAAVQTGFDSFMGRNNACQSGEKGRCVSAAPIMHYYMYRVQNDEDYSPENQNMANIPGALWYLHNEIVWHPWLRAGTYAATPKTRIERFLVFSRASQELYDKGMNFGVVNTYDLGKCSGPYKCENLEEYGPVVGCESWNPKAENNFPHGQWTGTNVYPNAVWYSLPGKCSSKKFWKQSGDCAKNEPSGACPLGVVPTGEWTCTYTYQKVGELRISDIENITSLEDLVEGGGREYSRKNDKGKKLHFWDSIHDPKACQKRVEKVKKMFAEKYPDQPVLDDPACDFNVGKFYPYFPAGTFDGPHETNATKNNNANISNATRLLVTWGNQSRSAESPSVI